MITLDRQKVNGFGEILQIIFLSDDEWNPYAFLTGNDMMQIWLIINP